MQVRSGSQIRGGEADGLQEEGHVAAKRRRPPPHHHCAALVVVPLAAPQPTDPRPPAFALEPDLSTVCSFALKVS